jgi:signal transduction histidine kinase
VEAVDAAALAEEVFRETQMIDKSHEYAIRLNDGEYPVRGDAQLLKQALRIFVDNAIKYTPAKGRITISLAAANGFVQLSVADTGIGIPAKDLPRIFDRFFRADESRARGTGGTGLGLSISKWIIDRHGGFVEIMSREDFGTKITAALPCYVPEPPPEPDTSIGPTAPQRLPESL